MSRTASHPTPNKRKPEDHASSTRGVRTSVAILVLVAALAFLAYRVQHALKLPSAIPTRLQLGDDVQLEVPPPPSTGDLKAVQANMNRLELLRSAYTVQPDDPKNSMRFARAAIQCGDLLSGRGALQHLIEKQTDSSVLVYDLLGRCQIELADYAGALRTYEHLIGREPNSVQGYIGKSRALTGLKRNAEAGQALVTGGTKIPESDLLGHLGLAGEFDRLRDLDSALKHAQIARAANPNDSPSAVLTAGVLFKLRRFDEAQSILQKRIDANPRDAGPRKVMAQILESPLFPRRDRALAEHYFLEVLRQMPGDPDTCWRLAQICADQGRYKQAAYLYSVLLEKAPDSAAGRKQYAAALDKLGNHAEAQTQQKYARELLERDTKLADLSARRDRAPSDPEAHARIARAQITAHRYQDGLMALQTAYNLAPQKYRSELRSLCVTIGLSMPDAKLMVVR